MTQRLRCFTVTLAVASFAVANAGIIAVTGDTVNLDANPGSFNFGSVKDGGNQANDSIWAFTERDNVRLLHDLTVNVDDPGKYYAYSDLEDHKPVIDEGTLVNSYMLYTDPKNSPKFYGGTVTFNEKILGVIVLSDQLEDSDAALGRLGTLYPHNDDARGLELGDGKGQHDDFPGEGITWKGDTITFDAKTYGNVDEIRVITAGAVPEPCSLAALGIGIVGLLRLRRKS